MTAPKNAIYVLVPIEITSAMVLDCTIAEPSTDETAWVSGGSYTAGDVRIRASTHRQYRAVDTHTGSALAPEDDSGSIHWVDIGPTDRWLAFDAYTGTVSSDALTLTYELQPGNFDAIDLRMLAGSTVTIQVLDGPGGSEIFPETEYPLQDPPLDEWDMYWGAVRQITKLTVSDIPPHPTAVAIITIEGGTTAAVGMITVGDFRCLTGTSSRSGALSGATAEPKTTSQIDFASDGTFTIRRGRAATDMSVEGIVPRDTSDYCMATLQEVLDIPTAWVASRSLGYGGLNVYGLGSGVLTYLNTQHDKLALKVKGIT